ncbi:extradiol ring-cleavage dioxygenase [Viridothelium virens]|uniref:Extradiol ring-cleavage dioxygenase n=1 Tax=Viridothelium virens TaxID=1048519 RepID=A0A6A6H294_VIRVR|nr:extradiol ring-cleavage dioxygenase [Viridothelium virens]
MAPVVDSSPARLPVYFISHGAPTLVGSAHPARSELSEIGKEIMTVNRPEAVVVFSAHWQASRDNVEVNIDESTDIIYDFPDDWPQEFRQIKYPHTGSKVVAESVMTKLQNAGIQAKAACRGLDHGIWPAFICLFDPVENPLRIPIVQVSLFGTEDPNQHYRLGQAIASLRDERVQIITSGMSVHNLEDYLSNMDNLEAKPYALNFDEALKCAVEQEPKVRQQKMAALLDREDFEQAHPTLEHLLPIYVSAGAAGEDVGERLWTMHEAGLGWGLFRFGKVPVAS